MLYNRRKRALASKAQALPCDQPYVLKGFEAIG